jgi:pyridinium-3,5-biscarboxylic acid mononucleotide sulfurtransferase
MPITDMVAERIGLSSGGDAPAKTIPAFLDRLHDILRRHDDLAVAVSGGIDSMTLGFIAHRLLAKPPLMVHAVSPAVPAEATRRIRDYAAREGWRLTLVDAGEFADPSYRANPVDRCYFCKSNLYDRIRGLSFGVIASGTNLDDLGDFRPGLKAAAERNVVHPFVEAGIGKDAIRELARLHSLADLAELPAQPCLASRVETGIRIEAGDLAFIDAVERQIREQLPMQADVRCRLTRHGVVLEVGGQEGCEPGPLAARAARLCKEAGRDFLGVKPYRQGSAFLRSSDQKNDFANRN